MKENDFYQMVTPCTKDERCRWEQAAGNQDLSEWVRDTLNEAASIDTNNLVED